MEVFLVVLCQVNFQVDFPNCISACSPSIFVFPPSLLSVFDLCMLHFLCLSFLEAPFSSMQASWHFFWIPAHWDGAAVAPAEHSPSSHRLSLDDRCSSPFMIFFSGSTAVCPCVSWTGKHRTGHSTPDMVSPVLFFQLFITRHLSNGCGKEIVINTIIAYS